MSVLSRWFARSPAARAEPRWAVVDVETTGLDMRHDELLAIAAVAVHFDAQGAPRIALADSFEAVLRRESRSTDKDNILLHGIGVGAQRDGAPPAEALGGFERWLGASPLVAFHSAFDATMIGRAMDEALGRRLANRWLDLEPVAAALHPQLRCRALDDWLAHFGIECAVRHQAAADTLATAELLLRLWPEARKAGCTGFEALAELARQQRWLGAGGGA